MPVIFKSSIDYSLNWTGVCNYALNRLGAEALIDLSDGTPNAGLCERFLPAALQHLLNEYSWNFAKKRARLAPLAEKPLFGWKEQFQLPVDLMRIIRVSGAGGGAVPYQIEGARLLSDVTEIEILYINRPLTANEMPYHFADALAAYMAALLAPAITSNEQIVALTLQQSSQQIEQAKRIDAGQNYAPEFEGERWYGEARN